MSNPAIIILNGALPRQARIDDLISKNPVIFCADGGANLACEAGLQPQYIVGDFDSISDEVRRQIPQAIYVHRPDQNQTDFEKTLDFVLENGYAAATVIGFSGGRFDHQLCNLNILAKYSNRLVLEFVDDFGRGFFIGQPVEFSGKIGQQVSLNALGKVEGLSTTGLKYPLDNESLEWAVRDGQSNEIVSNPVKISLRAGRLFVYVCHVE